MRLIRFFAFRRFPETTQIQEVKFQNNVPIPSKQPNSESRGPVDCFADRPGFRWLVLIWQACLLDITGKIGTLSQNKITFIFSRGQQDLVAGFCAPLSISLPRGARGLTMKIILPNSLPSYLRDYSHAGAYIFP